jgi:hypothetical protein
MSYKPIIEENKIRHEFISISYKPVIENNCNCDNTITGRFPIVCLYLHLLFIWRVNLAMITHNYKWMMLSEDTWDIAWFLNCRWTKTFIDVI